MLSQLNRQFSSAQVQFVTGEQNLIKAVINNTFACCEIYLYGAHVTSFVPHDQQDLLWLSPAAEYRPGKSIRGGIPLCWPWFGAHTGKGADKGPHGFARLMDWQLIRVENDEDGASCLTFVLRENAATLALWPFRFELQYQVTVADTLSVKLTTTNTNDSEIYITEALHSYLGVDDITQAAIAGLDGSGYIDTVGGRRACTQLGDIHIDQEVDRVYCHTRDSCVLTDKAGGRRIDVSKSGSDSTIVWNPWIDKAKQMADVSDQGYRHFVCIESGNAFDNVIGIAPGEQHSISQSIGCRRLARPQVSGQPDFSVINQAAALSFAQQRNLIKKLCRGKTVLCPSCQRALKLITPDSKQADKITGIRCDKGCTNIELEFSR